MLKPKRLKKGDRIAALSSSAGLAGLLPYRYNIGKKQLQDEFDIELVEMKHTLKDPEWTKRNPQARAEDLMDAFADPTIDGIISAIGGDDSIRMAKYVDIDIISNNPKAYIGYSDSTVSHLLCFKAGLTSFYGPSILANFAENQGLIPYFATQFRQTLFSAVPPGEIIDPEFWTAEYLDWFNPENQMIKRNLLPNAGKQVIQGTKTVNGHLLGGCIQVFTMLLGTDLWPNPESWKGAILFIEISESELSQSTFKYILRNLGYQGIFELVNGIIFGRPGGQRSEQECRQYEKALLEIVSDEFNCNDLPILSNMSFGHTDPVFIIPYGVMAEINCLENKFIILEAGVH
ncbi:LD-carboxypeptidase [Mucilaginibacter sp. HC2]|uniref:S66 family peptidase n=1 Tax=Mucilaginibacter inviolabilis TaxID=2714892 RepID=UPI001409D71C|nr:S66 peptidase family protein [Mucilaginibacter inviolabilis]NHA03452.1 LD-carboxypeptidase [Mucilaginibacter inviolabilis]